MWLESSLFKSLEIGGGVGIHTHTHTSAAGLVARLQPVMEDGSSYCADPGEKRGAEGEQRRAMLLTWQPSRHAKRVMRADSAEI